ncbi:hypothetical protein [Gordonia shandongensis]|uniref:hypothetical protein n=1 Tax=Gordonia shandongensis TaxID=376351 RepID=UPI000417E486|nr:hypothetical protein [Gordonia shandongensis]
MTASATTASATVVVAGTAGADPAGLAAELAEHGVDGVTHIAVRYDEPVVVGGARTVLLALDATAPAADEERAVLAAAARAGAAVAMVAVHVDRHPGWPAVIARSRTALDPDRRVPLFAVAPDAGDRSGVRDVVRWCTDDPPALSRPAPEEAVSPPVARRSVDTAAVLPTRAERLTAVRAGIVEVRGEAVAALREALRETAATATATGPGALDWLPPALDAVERGLIEAVRRRVDRIQASALAGLSSPGPPRPVEIGRDAGPPCPPPEQVRGRAEGAMLLIVGASMGFGVGRMVIAPALDWAGLGALGTALALAAGVLLAAWIVAVRRDAARRAAVVRWVGETVARRRGDMEHRLVAAVGAAEASIGREIWNRTRSARV